MVVRFWDHLFPVQNLGLHVHSSHVDEGSLIFFQSTSVLAHKLESNRERLLPTTDEEAIMAALDSDQPLGQQFEELFAEMNKHFGTPWGLMSSHRGWKGGLHIQSCGHHMHYDCRQSYCETLKQLMRVTREQVLILKIFFQLRFEHEMALRVLYPRLESIFYQGIQVGYYILGHCRVYKLAC